eukprot:gene40503-28133_t
MASATSCNNPSCGRVIEGQYLVVRAPHLPDKVAEQYFESVALSCAYCAKRLVGGHLD